MTNPLNAVRAVSGENFILPKTEQQKKMILETLHKLKSKKIKSKIKYKMQYEYEPEYFEGSGNVPFGYSADGED